METYDSTNERWNIEDVKAQAVAAHGNRKKIELLVTELQSKNHTTAYHAAWVLTHIKSSDIQYLNDRRLDLIKQAITTPHTDLRRLILTTLSHLKWTADIIDTSFLDFTLAHLADPKESTGVRTVCMRLAYKQCQFFPELASELRQTLLLIDPTDLKPAIKHSRQQILTSINKLSKP